jgi:hypothetical protein
MIQNPYFRGIDLAGGEDAGNAPGARSMSPEATQLLLEACASRGGDVMKVRTMGGLVIQANKKNFTTLRDARSEATWEGAVDELVRLGFLQDLGRGEVFRVTRGGYETADRLRGEQGKSRS